MGVFFPNRGMPSVPDFLPSVKFPDLGNALSFFLLFFLIFFQEKEKSTKIRSFFSIITALDSVCTAGRVSSRCVRVVQFLKVQCEHMPYVPQQAVRAITFITGEHSNQNRRWCVNIGGIPVFWVHRRF